MSPELINILIQLPIVAVFVWYSDRKDKQFQAFLAEQRKEYVAALERLTHTLDEHDDKTDRAIARMEERTRPRKFREQE